MILSNEKKSKLERGMQTRRKVLGNTHVDKTIQEKDSSDEDFQRFITESVWGTVWSRKSSLNLRDRSLITLAVLATSGHEKEFEMHIRATLNTSTSKEDVKEMLLHIASYVGVPVSNQFIKIAKNIYNKMDQD